MEVIIAGYNTTTLENLNPEVISASYARTSRDPRSIPEIREEAKLDIEKARKSNTNIVFGMGHASIAEHTVFNIDIIGVSRYLVEEIESHRLASYTEKSQRYVLFKPDYVTPDELLSDDKLKDLYQMMVKNQFKFYKDIYPKLLKYNIEKFPEKYEKDPKTVEGWAKEDARYALPMATKTQLGMTINARNLELMIRRLKACEYTEAHELAEKLYNRVYFITPSLFPHTDPSFFEIKNKKAMKESKVGSNLELLNKTNISDVKLSEVIESPYNRTFGKYNILKLLRNMNVYDSAPKEFEFIDFEFMLNISSSCYAQLKRHRMMSMIPYKYSVEYVCPGSFIGADCYEDFYYFIRQVNSIADNFDDIIKPYILTNAHKRNVRIKLNLREMYHFCRMRMDSHAQWEIRDVANEMHRLASEVCPFGMALCCGKDQFEETYKKLFD